VGAFLASAAAQGKCVSTSETEIVGGFCDGTKLGGGMVCAIESEMQGPQQMID